MNNKPMDFQEFLAYMGDKNPGAFAVFEEIMAIDKPKIIEALNKLEERGLRGKQIYDLYKECGQSATELLDRLNIKWGN